MKKCLSFILALASIFLSACSGPSFHGSGSPTVVDIGVPAAGETVAKEKPVVVHDSAVEQLLAQARESAGRGESDRALALFERAVRIEPRNPEPYFEMAKLQYKTGIIDRALQMLDKAASLATPGSGLMAPIARLKAQIVSNGQ